MAFNIQNLKRGEDRTAPRIIFYAPQGFGKTTFGASAPKPVFLMTEEGQGKLHLDRFDLAKSYEDVMEALSSLLVDPHEFETLVFDTLDWFEPMVWHYHMKIEPTDDKSRIVKHIEDYGFGKGYEKVLDDWREMLDLVKSINQKRDMMVLMNAHAKIKRYENPETDAYDRYMLKLQEKASKLVQENVDCVFFGNYATSTIKEKAKFNNERVRSLGAGERYIYTEERPAFDAKNRYDLEPRIRFDKGGNVPWNALTNAVPFLRERYGEKPIELIETTQPTT